MSVPFVRDADEIELAVAKPNEHGDIFTLINALPEPTILFRERRAFWEACNGRRAYVARLKEKKLVIGALIFVKDSVPHYGEEMPEEEVASLYVHPQMRGFRVASWLLRSATVHRYGFTDWRGTPSGFFAKVLKGNGGPHRALLDAGFHRDNGVTRLDPAQFAGAIDHMLEEGEDVVYAYRYTFVPADLDRLILSLINFIEQGAEEERGGILVRFRFDKKLLPVDFLDAHIRWVAATKLGMKGADRNLREDPNQNPKQGSEEASS